MPFTEPSIALRRRFDAKGMTSDWNFVIFRAQPDGGAYAPGYGEELFALRLAPEAMETGLGLSMRDHMDQDCHLPQRLQHSFDAAARLADAGHFLSAWQTMLGVLDELSDNVEIDRIGQAATLARRSPGMLGPAELADQAGLSARHMRRGFVDRLGLSPRAIVRRQRLTAAMLSAERDAHPDWADIAFAHRFSDQAHMIRECQALMGQTPGEWHRQRRRMAVSFNS